MSSVKLGLNIPLFVASLISIAAGTFTGMVGVWGYIAYKQAVPEWIKVGHAHAAWWSVPILLAAILLPGLPLASWFRKFVLVTAFICPGAWLFLGQYVTYGLHVESAMYIMPVFEISLFIALLGVALTASGFKIPFITSEEAKPGKYDMISPVEVDRRVFLVPTLLILVGVIAGFLIAAIFKAQHLPIKPAALVQLHDHTVIISLSSIIALLAMRVLNVAENVFKVAIRIMEVALPLVFLGLLAFNLAGIHVAVWLIPAGVYYILPVLAFLTAIGLLPKSPAGELPYIQAIRVSLAFVFAMLLILTAQGAYISLVWDTNPDITVTFKQPQGSPYPGPYPATFLGTAPVPGQPRGLENAHLSPNSWSHVAALWLITLALVGPAILERIKRPGLLYMLLVTIPMAPMFNMVGRYLAWWTGLPPGAPGGIGAMYYAGHPLKGFNIVTLFIIGIILIYLMRKARTR
ncbi:hypothetical protein D9Q81_05680 [Candidatus Korarchaeum cryptofilum]|uniref:Uncharacterized protein n=2 Tax=Candidatus Korarchaeia TaxID=3342163 RepID=A0A429GKV1_9CREN|nr:MULTISPECIES: hypothetical protein [Candidatus Korarchaeota]RSN68608.1 hypothetical protein D9Q81_05680 [Candidatus Korarchaeum cryptofilum]RSN74431.1 hypothetical protein D6D85_08065 [Candidatus Methanodesulfokores washburnensis]